MLSKISNILASLPSPFSKLEYVKLPRGFEESNISGALRSYLLGGSPNATFVTKLPQVIKNSSLFGTQMYLFMSIVNDKKHVSFVMK